MQPVQKKDKKHLIFLYAGVVFVALAIALGVYSFLQAERVVPYGKDKRALSANELPNEQKPTVKEVTEHKNDKDSYPKTIAISKLGILARIIPLTVSKDGVVESPANIHDVGWLKTTKVPSDSEGIIVLDGHVQGQSVKGVFSTLDTLAIGEGIVLTQGDGTQTTFTVTAKKVIAYNESPEVSLLAEPSQGALELRLITCIGTYNKQTRTYDKRLLITAKKQ